MLRRYIQRGNALQSPFPQFFHEPSFIAFRSWTAILSLKGTIPEETRANEAFLFLDESADACGTERISVRGPVCLRNPSRITHLNVAIVCARSGQEVFFVRELPAGRFLHLKFLQEGPYTLHYSPAFSPSTLRRDIHVFARIRPTSTITHNFHPRIKPKRWA
jgi:hypothetical protein